jgi:hypothetical protein
MNTPHPWSFPSLRRLHLRAIALGSLLALLAVPSLADMTTKEGRGLISTDAHLDFSINIDRVIYLRVGNGATGSLSGVASGTGPPASADINTLSFVADPLSALALPGAALQKGINQSVNWDGRAPSPGRFGAHTLPVEVRSNAGQVRLTAQVSTALSSGSHTIPMSDITISSSDAAHLPAPSLGNTGAEVNVGLGGHGTKAAPLLLTHRTADWTFRYVPTTAPVAGLYKGQITFSACAL